MLPLTLQNTSLNPSTIVVVGKVPDEAEGDHKQSYKVTMTTLRAAPSQNRLQVLGEKQGPRTGKSRYLISPKRTSANPMRSCHKNKEKGTHR